MCYATQNPDELAEVEGQVRSHMAYYIGGMGTYYYDLFCRSGFQAEADGVREAWAARDRGRAAEAISSQMLDGIAVLGDADTCRERLNRFRDAGADMPVITFPHGSPYGRHPQNYRGPRPQTTWHQRGAGLSRMKIGLISDTHAAGSGRHLPDKILRSLRGVDLILHCGDLECLGVLDYLESVAPVLAVAGIRGPHGARRQAGPHHPGGRKLKAWPSA